MTGHYDHHMGADQDANWCVTRPWFDWIMGTRKPYAFTLKETQARLKKVKKALKQRIPKRLPRLSSIPPSNENVATGAA